MIWFMSNFLGSLQHLTLGHTDVSLRGLEARCAWPKVWQPAKALGLSHFAYDSATDFLHLCCFCSISPMILLQIPAVCIESVVFCISDGYGG